MMRVRKVSLTESEESEARYRGLLEAAPDAMIVVKEDGEIVLLNARVEKQFGYGRDELVGRNVAIIIPEGFKERLFSDALRSRADALAQQIGSGLELSGRRSDGTEFPIEIMLSPLESGGETLVTGAIRDITERRRIEEALRQSEERARELLENATGAIYISSIDGTVVQVNRAAEKLEGRPRLEIVGRQVLESIAPEERERTGKSFGDILSAGSVLGFETRSLRADGTSVPTEVLASLVEVGGERFIHATVHDVSQRKSLEEQLRHAQKMEAVGRLAAGIAHDFNNLLMVILGSSEILELHRADPEAIRRDIEELRHAAERGAPRPCPGLAI
jgi:PAS domain S-box-containing protein